MAQVDSQPAADLPLQPSPVLLEAVLKVEQVVARLQNLQTTISGIQLSPVNPRHTRTFRANTTTSALKSKDCASGKESSGPTQRRDEYRQKPLKCQNGDSKPVQPPQPSKSKEWKQWSSPANQVHDVISEILMASEFAKQIASLVAEALHDGPQKTQEPADQIQKPKRKVSKDVKRRDIAFPSKAQVQKTMSAKAPPSKPVNKYKVAFPSDSAAKLAPPGKPSRLKDPPASKGKCGAGSPQRRRISRATWSNSSSPNPLSPRSPHHVVHSPETKPERHKLFSSPSGSFRDSADADDELAGPMARRLSMTVTEIKGSSKPWKLTPTRGVLFSNPVYLESPPTKSSPARPSPARIAPTTGRRRSWLTHQFPKPQSRCSPETDRRLRSSPTGNSLASSVSKATFKRESVTKAVTGSLSKGNQKTRKVAVPSRYVEMVPLDGPQNSSLVTMLDVLEGRSLSRLPTSRLEAKNGSTNTTAVTDKREEIVEDPVQCRVSHSHTESTPDVEKVANSKQGGSFDVSDKENAPVPSCAPNAAKFLRSMSSGHALNRTLSRKNSGASLFQRAKGWMSSQAVRQGRVRELERSPETTGFTSTRRYSLPGQLQAPTCSRRYSLPGQLQAPTCSRRFSLPGQLQGLASALETES